MKISNLRDKIKIIANFKGEKNVTLSMIFAKVREYYTIIVLCIHFFFFGYERKCNGKQHFFLSLGLYLATQYVILTSCKY